ncbi:uncharacterized protein [Littorina saxatilis]|uniref:uncharacterized protein n=1 Tax=Littorina saxatilis TaxID=31220 RepID=UPI0038B67360
MWTALCLIVMVNWMLNSLTTGMEHLTTSSWRRLSGQDLAVSGYEVWARGRSKVECIRECNKYSHCTSFVFNVSSRTCYLQPALDNTANTAHLGLVYVNTEPDCSVETAPTLNGSVNWAHTLTSLRGKVTCYDDFINTTNDVFVQCNADGSWEWEGGCIQYVWKDPPMSMFPVGLPFPVKSGWSVCVEGIPTSNERFTVELMTASGSQPLHADFRFRFDSAVFNNTIYLGYRLINGSFTGGQGYDDFPFTVGQLFRLGVKATNNATFEIYVDDIIRATFPQHPELPASDVTTVNVRNNVTVTRLDLWCNV